MSLEALHQLIIKDTGSELTFDYDTNNPSDHNVSIQSVARLDGCGQSPAASGCYQRLFNEQGDHAYSNEEIMADLTALMETHGSQPFPSSRMGHSYACNVILPMLLAKEHKFPNLTACIFLSSAVRCPENPNPDGGHWMLRSPVCSRHIIEFTVLL
jgi:hypothetical protein